MAATAALGHAARRLGGGALRQMLSPRFAHTEVQLPYTCGKPGKDGALKQIQEKKEELYDLMAEAHKTYGTDEDRASMMNKQLLEYLSGHVEPRPYDRTWRSNRESEAINEFMENTGLLTFCGGRAMDGVDAYDCEDAELGELRLATYFWVSLYMVLILLSVEVSSVPNVAWIDFS